MNRFARLALCLTAGILPATMSAAARAADAPPATKPAERVTVKLTAKHPETKEDVTVILDWTESPESEAWARKAGEYALKVYPAIEKAIASEGYKPAREFRLLFKKTDGVPAFAQGTTITINSDHIARDKEDWGMVAHELTHVIQKYRRGGEGWLTEGIADWVRYYVIEPGAKRARFNIDTQTYKNAYQPAAGLLDYVERTKGPGTVNKMNALLRAGKWDKEKSFKEIAGGTPDELWDQFKASKKKDAEKKDADKKDVDKKDADKKDQSKKAA